MRDDFFENRTYEIRTEGGERLIDHVLFENQNEQSLFMRLKEPAMLDESMFARMESDQFSLSCMVVNEKKGILMYSTRGLIPLTSFLKACVFGKEESYVFVQTLIERAIMVNRSKPVLLDTDFIFISPHGDQMMFTVLPLKLEYWMFQRDESIGFIMQILDQIQCPQAYELIGFAYQFVHRPEFSLPNLYCALQDLRTVYCPCRFWKKPLESFYRKEPVSLIGSLESYYSQLSADGMNEDNSKDSPWTTKQNQPESEAPYDAQPMRLQTSCALLPDESYASSGSKGGRKKQRLAGKRNGQKNVQLVLESSNGMQASNSLKDPSRQWKQTTGRQISESDSGRKGNSCDSGLKNWSQAFESNPGLGSEALFNPYEKTDAKRNPKDFNDSLQNSASSDPDHEASSFESQRKEKLQPENADDLSIKSRKKNTGLQNISPIPLQTSSDFCPSDLPERSDLSQDDVRTQIIHLEETACAWLEIGAEHYDLRFETMTIGRHGSNDIRLDSPKVSSHHAKIIRDEQNRYYLQDLKSSNKTWIFDKQVIRRMRLREGMEIRFADVKGVFHEQPL